jgi:hypothetical protein
VYVTIDGVWIGEWIYYHLQVVTANKYNIIAISTFYSSLEHTVYCSQYVTRRFLVTAPTMAILLPAAHVQNWLSSLSSKPPDYNISARTTENNAVLLLLHACMLRALPSNGRCLHSRRLATGLYATALSRYFPRGTVEYQQTPGHFSPSCGRDLNRVRIKCVIQYT